MDITTTTCRPAHPEFFLRCGDEIPESFALWLRDSLASAVNDGERFAPGQTYQVGWMTTRVAPGPEQMLTLHEPDMRSMPVQWVESVAQTLRHLMLHRFTAESVGLGEQLEFPKISQTCLVCKEISRASTTSGLLLSRFPADGAGDSGWFVGCLDESHDHNVVENLARITLYELVRGLPELVSFLALPEGCEVVLQVDKRPAFFFEDQQMPILAGSYVDQLFSV